MKKISTLITALFFLIISAGYILAETHMDSEIANFTVERMVIAGSIEDREPVGVVNLFSSSTEKVYCFLEARDITEDTSVTFVWYHEENEMARVELPLKEGPRWRTYSSKQLAGLTGTWQVVLQDADGTIVRTAEFSVE